MKRQEKDYIIQKDDSIDKSCFQANQLTKKLRKVEKRTTEKEDNRSKSKITQKSAAKPK
jgi:hypothetical protein